MHIKQYLSLMMAIGIFLEQPEKMSEEDYLNIFRVYRKLSEDFLMSHYDSVNATNEDITRDIERGTQRVLNIIEGVK